jgi:hypothetical protein
MAGPGRNAPCPCGSGKKFKHCCLSRTQTATGITPRDRTEAFDALLKYSRRDEFDRHVAEAALQWAGLLPDDSPKDALQDILEFETSAQAFFDWMFFDVPARDGRTIADAFLAARAWTVSDRAANYVRLMRTTSLRLYQIRDVDRGQGFTVRDLWTKENLTVTERRGSTQLVRWDILAARIVRHADGTNQIEGAVMALPPNTAKPLLGELKADHRRFVREHPAAPLADFFKQAAPLFADVWVDEVALREPPTRTTTEGDLVTHSTMVFDVPRAGEALVKLLRQPDFEAGTIGRAIWVEGAGDRQRILGDVECDKGMLTLTTFSSTRAARARTRLEEILGPLTVRSEEHRELDPDDRRPHDTPPPELIDISEVPELQSWLREQDREWLDTSVPALDGRTPREAAADRRLRPRLRDLLIGIENREARLAGTATGRDVTWMWKELGLRRP